MYDTTFLDVDCGYTTFAATTIHAFIATLS